MGETPDAILRSLKLSEGLKRELRHSWLSDGRRESVAEHCWNMSLLAILVHPHLEHPVDLERALRMVIVHDLVEAEAGDVPFFEVSERQTSKLAREAAAMERITGILPAPSGATIAELWHEFEAAHTPEAKLVKALDNLEVQIQHIWADIATWEAIEYDLVYTKMERHCAHDRFLRELCAAVRTAAEEKLVSCGIDVQSIKQRLGVE